MAKTKSKDWFNDEIENINIIGSKKLKLEGSLKILDFTKLKSISLKKLELTKLKICSCSQLTQIDLSELTKLTSLSVINCPKLTKLDCSSTETLTELEVSDLIELNCSNTLIEELYLNFCPNITKLVCSNNKKLINLDVSNCSKLEFLDCSNSKLTSLDLSYCTKSIDIRPFDLDIIREEKNKKNILIVGCTGSGRSTLANVLTGSADFNESGYAVSEKKEKKGFNKKVFKWSETNYCVVDTVGFEDTKLTTKKVLYKIAEGIYSMPEGISQVLFVVDGKFVPEKMSSLNLISNVFFEIGILDYVTIVRTKFSGFRNKGECDKDKRIIFEECEKFAKIVDSRNIFEKYEIVDSRNIYEEIAKIVDPRNPRNKIIHVDNPPTNIVKDDDDSNYHINQINVNRNARKRSREKLLDYLEEIWQRDLRSLNNQEEYFKVRTWDKLWDKITQYADDNDPELKAEYNESKEFCLIT